MTELILLIVAVVSLLAGSGFYWLNRNTPFQTFLPAVFLPLGTACLLLWLGGKIA